LEKGKQNQFTKSCKYRWWRGEGNFFARKKRSGVGAHTAKKRGRRAALERRVRLRGGKKPSGAKRGGGGCCTRIVEQKGNGDEGGTGVWLLAKGVAIGGYLERVIKGGEG